MKIKDLIVIKSFFAPKLINIMFWIMILLVIFLGIGLMVEGYDVISKIFGILYIIIGALVTRIIVEIMLIPFKIYEKVSFIEKQMLEDEEKYNKENIDANNAVVE